MSSRYFSGEDERAIGLEDLKNFSPANLGIDLSNLPTIDPESIQQMPASTTGGIPGLDDWWKEAGYPDAVTAIQSGNFRYDMNRGWLPKEETSTNMGAMTSPTLGPLGTSGMSMMEGEPMTIASTDLGRSGASSLDRPEEDPEFLAYNEEMFAKYQAGQAAKEAAKQATKDMMKEASSEIDPVQAAVDAAVGNGQPTTDDTILNLDDMEREESKTPFGFGENFYSGEGFIPPPAGSMNTMAIVDYYNPSTGQVYKTMSGGYTAPEGWISGTKEDYEGNKEYYDNILAGEGTGTDTGTQQPDFMTQLQELIAQMQGEQTAAAEQAAAAEAERQKQAAEMTQNYMVGEPAVGYNPYESGQYQNNPYGSAGVPDMGGITSIPVPAAYQPYQPPGGTT
jgi:hypothetical protein